MDNVPVLRVPRPQEIVEVTRDAAPYLPQAFVTLEVTKVTTHGPDTALVAGYEHGDQGRVSRVWELYVNLAGLRWVTQ